MSSENTSALAFLMLSVSVIIPKLQNVDEKLRSLVPPRNSLNTVWVAMNTNTFSISTPLKVRYFQEGILCWKTNYNPPPANPLLFNCTVRKEKEKRKKKEQKRCYGHHLSGWETNESLFFLASAPQMRRSVMEDQGSTYVSLCDREITLRWQKASATSITCTVLPAIVRSLKAILKWLWRGNIFLPRWSKVLSGWLAKHTCLCCDAWQEDFLCFNALFPLRFWVLSLLFHCSVFYL